jgi:hypothetical protein
MPQARDIKDPARWRARAEEFRELAEDVSDEQVRQSMLRLAKVYDHVAIRAEKRSRVEYGALISMAIIVAAFVILMLRDRWAG